MKVTILTSREFNQDATKAKQAAESGPVIITDRSRPAHVLLTFADYKKLTAQQAKIADLLAMPGVEDVELLTSRIDDRAPAADLD